MLLTSSEVVINRLDKWHDCGVALYLGATLYVDSEEIKSNNTNPMLLWALDLGYRLALQLDQCTNQHEEK